MEERRQFKRILSSLFIRFTIDESDFKNCEGFSEDLSTEGIRLRTNSRLSINDNLNLSIDVPNNPDMTLAEGKVKWIGKDPLRDENGRLSFPVGVEITYIDRHDKNYLKDYLTHSCVNDIEASKASNP